MEDRGAEKSHAATEREMASEEEEGGPAEGRAEERRPTGGDAAEAAREREGDGEASDQNAATPAKRKRPVVTTGNHPHYYGYRAPQGVSGRRCAEKERQKDRKREKKEKKECAPNPCGPLAVGAAWSSSSFFAA